MASDTLRGDAGRPDAQGDREGVVMTQTETTKTRAAPSARHEVTVWLDQPLWGRDHATGELVQSNRHRVEAAYVLQDAVSTQVADEDGEVLLAFPTPAVTRLTWTGARTPASEKAAPTPPEAPAPITFAARRK